MRAQVLVANEWIKLRTRTATWVSLGVFLALTGLIFGGQFFQSLKGKPNPGAIFPRAWGEILGGPGVLSCFFAAILLILLVGGEYTWRTARQNVIDGLSKEEFFAAKLVLLPGIALLFFAALMLVGGGFATAGTIRAAITTPWITDAYYRAMGGAFLGLLGWGSLAFLCAMTIRSSGSAIGAFFLYFIVEQILGGLAGQLGKSVGQAATFLPVATFKVLWEPALYGAVPLREGQSMPFLASSFILAGAAWVTLFIVVAFVLYKRRDL